jgi:hypothetical protein
MSPERRWRKGLRVTVRATGTGGLLAWSARNSGSLKDKTWRSVIRRATFIALFLPGGYCTVRVTALEWLSGPEVAVTITVLVPGGVPVCVAAL